MMFPITRRALTSMRIMRLACPGVVLVPAKVPAVERTPCPDPECATTTDEHKEGCAVAMNTFEMHRSVKPGLEPGRF
jgi:hypothetical protein